MPAINFTVFIDKVLNGTKCQTIRRRRFAAGDILYLKAGMRTKNVRHLKTVICETSTPMYRVTAGNWWLLAGPSEPRRLSTDELEAIAKADGFTNLNDFEGFFDKHYSDHEVFWETCWKELTDGTLDE